MNDTINNSNQLKDFNIHDAQQKDVAVNDSTNKWMKNEYVPVTSFIHTVRFDNFRRIYQAYETPTSYYANNYYYNTVTAK